MPSYKKGYFVIEDSEGSVQLNGAAALVNDAKNAGVQDATPTRIRTDAAGVPTVILKSYNEYRATFRLTPGVGSAFADQAAIKTAISALRKGMAIITSGFEDADFNWPTENKAIIEEVGKTLSEGETLSVDVTAVKRAGLTTAGADGTVIDFTGTWVTL